MVVDRELEELLEISVRRFVERHQSAFDALSSADPRNVADILDNASREAKALGWLGSLAEHDVAEADSEIFSRLLATLVRELGRVCPAFALRLLAHHHARVCVLGTRPEHARASHPSIDEWLGLEATLADSRFAPMLQLTQRGHSLYASGSVRFVIGGDLASQWLAWARGVESTPSLVLLRRDAALVLAPVATLGLTGMGAIDTSIAACAPTSAESVATGDDVQSRLARANRILWLSHVSLMQVLVEQSRAIAQTHAMTRRQNGTVLARIPAVARHLHTIDRAITLMRMTAGSYASHSDEGCRTLPDLVRISREAADCALQVLGGAGYIVGHGAERCWRDVLQLGEIFPNDPW